MKKNILLVGLGPHSKRIYLNYFKKHNSNLAIVVDLYSNKENVRAYLDENGFKDTYIFSVPDKYKDNEHLPEDISRKLLNVCQQYKINKIIISTEPKGHYMYLEFALTHNIDVLTDKPITVVKNMTSLRSIKKVRKQYYTILNLAKKSKAKCNVMCQRQYHRGYEYVKSLLKETVEKYKIPITYIDIYHCDGNWEMPHDLDKENHPYKYGYGKLFHSGYHFIDLLSDFIKINNVLEDSKKITQGQIFSRCFTPNDELAVFNIDDYKRIFKNQNIPKFYYENTHPNFDKYGEKNFYGLLEFKNCYNQTITSANLNLLHYGFSRRGWIESRDFYKKNGRIRHERINIQVGPLMNIQIHSYQSKEIKDRLDNKTEEQIGGLEHFDIDIYRNVDIIGGKPYEKIKLGDLYSDDEKQNILGYNELSREIYLNNFLNGNCRKGDIRDQALAIEILYSCALGIRNYYENKEQIEDIIVRNRRIYPIQVDDFKMFSNKSTINDRKIGIKHYATEGNDYEFGVFINYLTDKKEYEVFLYVADNYSVSSLLLHKIFYNKQLALLYYCVLKRIVNFHNIYFIAKLVGLKV